MIASMTGFGRAECKENGWEVVVEVRSLNHRFLDVEVRAPKPVLLFEHEVKELIRSRVNRGRISATIAVKGEEAPAPGLAVDIALAKTYLRLLRELKHELGIDGEIGLHHLLTFSDIFGSAPLPTEAHEKDWAPIKKALERALEDLVAMRLREGEEIKKDLLARLEVMEQVISAIEKHARVKPREVFDKLRERVKELVAGEAMDPTRVEMEVALLAERADVTEECIRFKSHITLFRELLEQEGSEGRKLNFLLQEMHREANTIGAKASDAQVAHWVVEIKEEVEKLREQIQNIE